MRLNWKRRQHAMQLEVGASDKASGNFSGTPMLHIGPQIGETSMPAPEMS